jgi:PAS domain S-box-containing protein
MQLTSNVLVQILLLVQGSVSCRDFWQGQRGFSEGLRMEKKPTHEELARKVEELEQRIVEQGRAYEVRAEEAEALQSLLNAFSETAILIDLEGVVLKINETAARRLGKTVDEMIGTELVGHFPPDLTSYRKARGEEVARTGKLVRFQDERDGRIYDTHDYPVFDRQGKVGAIAIYSRDITENIRVVQALLESEENFRSLAENANDGILIATGEGVHVYVNRKVSEIAGYTIDELLETGITDLAHPDEAEGIVRRFGKRIRGEKTRKQYETWIIRKDGTPIPIEVTASRTIWKGEPSTLVIMRDITERSQMERDLRRSEERFRAIFEGALDAIYIVDPETGRILDANPAASELLLRDNEEIADRHYLDLFPADWKGTVREAYEGLFEEEERIVSVVAGMMRSDGSEVPVEVLGQLIQIDGVPVIQAIVRDITDRKRMDEELRDSEEQFRTLAEASLAGIFVFQDGKFRYANPALGRIFGYELDELIGRMGPIELILPEDREMADAYGRQCLKGMEEESPVFTFRGVKRDGSLIDCEVLQAGIEYRGRRAVIGTLLDVTRRKRMEEELLKTQKLESLGVLAGGIAHDFNNILTAISTNISMARMYGDLEEDISEMLGDAEKASVRAKNLTQQLLSFSRGGGPVRRAVSMTNILEENTEFALSGSNVKCEYSIPKELRQVEADEGQIGQVIHNLVINAVQAMPEGGVIKVGAENVSPGELETLPLKPDRYVKIFVTDHGIGIPARHSDKIFDPFFTTKQKGSGLGLSSAFTIVRNHEGHLQVDSEVGVGTTVRVYLPVSDERTSSREETRGRPLRGQGRVLLVDDEQIIRASASEALTRLGYDVKLAVEGTEGVRIYEQAMKGGQAFDVVLLDLTIPGGMGGKDAVRELLRSDPNARVIASSGYSNDPVMADYRAYGFRDVIVKPYRIDDLSEVLHRVINAPND